LTCASLTNSNGSNNSLTGGKRGYLIRPLTGWNQIVSRSIAALPIFAPTIEAVVMVWARGSQLNRIEGKLDRLLTRLIGQGVMVMATLADIQAADAQVKAELDAIASGVTSLVASNKDLAAQLEAAIAANDPVQMQATLDAANALVAEGQAIVDSLPAPAAPAP
jgi:uncharacterized membrane protein affecting hemolysin expression